MPAIFVLTPLAQKPPLNAHAEAPSVTPGLNFGLYILQLTYLVYANSESSGTSETTLLADTISTTISCASLAPMSALSFSCSCGIKLYI